jgi:hypothetical protein
MLKDGLVIFLVTLAFSSSVRLSRRISLTQAVIGALSLWGLWYVRFYLVFVVSAPLLVGALGLRTKNAALSFLVLLSFIIGVGLVAAFTDALKNIVSFVNLSFEEGNSEAARTYYAVGDTNVTYGSGVIFDDAGSPWRAFGPKVLYTLLSPFPWQEGSIGFHLSKIDVVVWYYFLWRVISAARRLWRDDRALVLMFLVFLVPTTLMYATSMSNIGLIFRQRLPIVAIGMVLATLSWPAVSMISVDERSPKDGRRPGRPRMLSNPDAT